jgi:pyocin large subunit-like protein
VSRAILYLAGLSLLAAVIWIQETKSSPAARASNQSEVSQTSSRRPGTDAVRTWGNPASLPDHFARHGAEVGARNQEEYALMAWQFLQRAKSEGLPAKVDASGTLRIFDHRSGAFGAYNRNGTTKTFFKPGQRSYFDRQPGQSVDLRTWK